MRTAIDSSVPSDMQPSPISLTHKSEVPNRFRFTSVPPCSLDDRRIRAGFARVNSSIRAPLLCDNRLHPSHLTAREANFNAVRVSLRIRQNILHDTARQLACRLILLQHDVDR
jgi:hypothetical protein